MSKKLPITIGSTYVYRVAKGRIAACRAIGTRDGYTALVGVAWDGEPGATFDAMKRDRRFRRPQWLDHHNWKTHRPPHVVGEWVKGVPKGMRFVGIAPVTSAESALLAKVMLTGSFALQGKLQWRWDHERAKVNAEDRKAAVAQEKRELAAARAARRARIKLRQAGPRALSRHVWFSDFRPPKMREACRALMRELVADLVRGPRRVERIARCMRAFNALDGKHGHSFDTPDAEQIVEALHAAADASGVSDAVFEREVDALRDF